MTLLSNRTPWSTSLLLVLVGCSPMSHASPDAAPTPDAFVASDVATSPDALVATPIDAANLPDAYVVDAPPVDAPRLSYTRDVRPVLEASRCGDCHAGSMVEMSYAWISAPGTTWCRSETYAARWSCFEEHARTQTGDEAAPSCGSTFYHRHGQPCFTEAARATVLAWAAGGFAE
jgi:hypothetical protein